MNEADVLEVAREAIIVMIKISAPVMIMALIVGLVISLVQALTQIQEMTLAFVPKIIVIFVSMLLLLPFMLATLTGFTERLMERIVNPG
ncbi:flagellar biosynthesis protein FliQ [Rhodospirillaceae bacterium SYSU D60014]|uniref:flagellar biosynthesis protein FliQ n=1 Tax=Virgifigura deserti TaxID=2268457 RepID=UPI000E66B6C4